MTVASQVSVALVLGLLTTQMLPVKVSKQLKHLGMEKKNQKRVKDKKRRGTKRIERVIIIIENTITAAVIITTDLIIITEGIERGIEKETVKEIGGTVIDTGREIEKEREKVEATQEREVNQKELQAGEILKIVL
jgi:hypothetical protein